MLVSKSITGNDQKRLSEDISIPPLSKGFFSDRVHLHYLYCVNKLKSPSSTEFTAIMKLDPKISFGLPDSVLSWFINQLAGVVLPLLRKQANHVRISVLF